MSKTKDKERILKAAIEKIITYKETSLAIKGLKGKKCRPGILYSAKLSFRNER